MSEEFSPPDDRIEPLQDRAATIVEALPYIQRFAGECVVVKFGGHAMANEAVQRSFARDVTLMRSIGVQVIVVHGGGPEIKKSLERFGIESTFRSGMRVTSDEVMEVVQMELLGRVNPRLVSLIQQSGGRAVGLSGIDGRLLLAERLLVDGESIGRVGQVRRVDDSELQLLGKGGFIPVIAPVGVDESGVSMNINADLAASAIASHMLARKLILMTDVPGIKGPDGRVASTLDLPTARAWAREGVVSGGMLPKLRCAFDALEAGVEKVHIVDGRLRHALLLEIFTDEGVGTEVVDEGESRRRRR